MSTIYDPSITKLILLPENIYATLCDIPKHIEVGCFLLGDFENGVICVNYLSKKRYGNATSVKVTYDHSKIYPILEQLRSFHALPQEVVGRAHSHPRQDTHYLSMSDNDIKAHRHSQDRFFHFVDFIITQTDIRAYRWDKDDRRIVEVPYARIDNVKNAVFLEDVVFDETNNTPPPETTVVIGNPQNLETVLTKEFPVEDNFPLEKEIKTKKSELRRLPSWCIEAYLPMALLFGFGCSYLLNEEKRSIGAMLVPLCVLTLFYAPFFISMSFHSQINTFKKFIKKTQ